MANKKIIFGLTIAIALLVFFSGCTTPPGTSLPSCGNGITELGEQCDGNSDACTEGKICMNNCSCAIPSPPVMPE